MSDTPGSFRTISAEWYVENGLSSQPALRVNFDDDYLLWIPLSDTTSNRMREICLYDSNRNLVAYLNPFRNELYTSPNTPPERVLEYICSAVDKHYEVQSDEGGLAASKLITRYWRDSFALFAAKEIVSGKHTEISSPAYIPKTFFGLPYHSIDKKIEF